MAAVKVDGVEYPDAQVRFETEAIKVPESQYDPKLYDEHMPGATSCCIHIPSANLRGEVTVEYEGHGVAQGEAGIFPVPNSRQLQTVIVLAEPFQAAPR
jgi:hypothetical protein